jgi:type IV secretion system protein VirD4
MPNSVRGHFGSSSASDVRATDATAMRLPDSLPQPGLLVGWSLELEHRKQPIGFGFGDPELTPREGWLDPVLLEGEGHIITIAPTGTGKGRSCIIPALLRHDGPVIVIDPKGENVAVTARRRREMGHQVVVLDPMGLTDEEPGSFNPLDLVDASSADAVDIVASYASVMVDGGSDPRNSFWYQRAQSLLSGLMLHSCTSADPGERTLAATRRLLAGLASDKPGSSIAKNATNEELLNSPHPEARIAGQSLRNAAAETIGSILSMTQNGIDFLRGPMIERATASTSFDVDAVTRGEPLSIYLVLPPHMMESHGSLLRLWVMALMSLITRRRGRPERSTLFIIDEAAQLGTLPQLRQAVTLLRGYGLQCWSLWQDVSQLRLLYPRDWETMVNNCQVVQCFGALNLMAAEAMARLTGYGSPEVVLDLEQTEMLLQIAGEPAQRARKPDYLTDPAFRGMFDPNPYHDPAQPVMPDSAPRVKLLEKAPEPPSPPRAPARRNARDVTSPETSRNDGPEDDLAPPDIRRPRPDPLHRRLYSSGR